MKKKVLHIIFNLGRGGAETMLLTIIKNLTEYNHTILTLFPQNDFGEELPNGRLICMNLKMKDLILFPITAWRMRKIIKTEQPNLIHTHLIWPTILARIGAPRKIPLLTTIHTYAHSNVDYRHWYFRILDRITYGLRPSVIIAVSKGALKEYFEMLKKKPGDSYVLYTFADIQRFKPISVKTEDKNELRLISVGSLSYQKNHVFLIDVFKQLKDVPISLDIYGKGPLENELKNEINKTGVNIRLAGVSDCVEDILPGYDACIMPSHYEGFSLSVLEAMASKVPLLLSTIPSFKEQCEDTAIYFSIDHTEPLKKLLIELINDRSVLSAKAESAFKRVHEKFTLTLHLEGLRNIYKSQIQK